VAEAEACIWDVRELVVSRVVDISLGPRDDVDVDDEVDVVVVTVDDVTVVVVDACDDALTEAAGTEAAALPAEPSAPMVLALLTLLLPPDGD
jgi:hypothetical protein